jgi:hypothetical protein
VFSDPGKRPLIGSVNLLCTCGTISCAQQGRAIQHAGGRLARPGRSVQ